MKDQNKKICLYLTCETIDNTTSLHYFIKPTAKQIKELTNNKRIISSVYLATKHPEAVMECLAKKINSETLKAWENGGKELIIQDMKRLAEQVVEKEDQRLMKLELKNNNKT